MPLYEIITIEHINRVYHMEAASEAEARERFETNDYDDNQALLVYDDETEEEEIVEIRLSDEDETAVA